MIEAGGHRTSVLVVEDHTLMRTALVEAVERLEGFAVDASVGSAEEALALIEGDVPEILIVDLALPSMAGDELIELLMGRHPELRCLVVSGHREAHYARGALAAGARGYVVKGNPAEVSAAILAVCGGQTYLSPVLGEL